MISIIISLIQSLVDRKKILNINPLLDEVFPVIFLEDLY